MTWALGKTIALVGLLWGASRAVIATDLTTYPTSLLGPVSRAAESLPRGVMHCEISGSLAGSPKILYKGNVRLVMNGVKDADGFGHFLPGSWVYYTGLAGGNFSYSCRQNLDAETSKYTMNKSRQGIIRLVGAPSDTCGGYMVQWTFLLDDAGQNAFLTVDDATQSGGVPGNIGSGQCRRP